MIRAKQIQAMGVVGLTLTVIVCAHAQTGTARTSPNLPSSTYTKLPVKDVANRISRASGVVVLADRTVANLTVTVTTPSGPVEKALARVVAALPNGVVYKKVYLPASAPGAPAPTGDQVSALVVAQDAVMGKRPATTIPAPEGEVDILGRRISADKAAAVVAALDLKPVYLLTNPASASDPVVRMGAVQEEALRAWLGMTAEQQATTANQQLDMLFNMDPALRRQLFSTQRQFAGGMMQRIQNLPQNQRREFFLDMTGGKWDGTGTPPGGAGVPGGQGGQEGKGGGPGNAPGQP